MTRLIDADKLKNYLYSEPYYSDSINDRTDIREHIDQMPTVDAVPVIRCKDCKHWYCYGDETFCSELGIYDTNKESYCSYAKRKEK